MRSTLVIRKYTVFILQWVQEVFKLLYYFVFMFEYDILSLSLISAYFYHDLFVSDCYITKQILKHDTF